MKNVKVTQIRELANKYSASSKKWHFHILTPECQLNEKDKYALVLENISDSEIFVCYSDEPYMDIGKELVKLLHGNDVVKDGKESVQSSEQSNQIKKILDRAKQLNESGKSWHHHVLFPDCRFNKHSGKWTIFFEDKETNKIFESISDEEPKNDLRHIETLFYQQKKVV